MNALLISLALFGQANTVLPPLPALDAAAAPIPGPAAGASESVTEMKTWLLTRLIVDLSFDPQKIAEVEKMIDTMSEQQMRVLVAVYKERSTKRDQSSKAQLDVSQQQLLNQAKLDLQQAEAYRDHLKREYDRQILQGHMTQNLVYQNILNQRMMYQPYGAYTYGGFGYSPMVYGGYGYAPVFGGPVMYGNPYYGGRGF